MRNGAMRLRPPSPSRTRARSSRPPTTSWPEPWCNWPKRARSRCSTIGAPPPSPPPPTAISRPSVSATPHGGWPSPPPRPAQWSRTWGRYQGADPAIDPEFERGLLVGLRRDPEVRLQGLEALRELRLGVLVGHGGDDDHVLAFL